MAELSRQDFEQIARAQRSLLAYRQSADQAVLAEVVRDISGLLGSDHAGACISHDADFSILSLGIGPQFENWMSGNFLDHDIDGYIRMRDPQFEAFNRARRQMGSGVYSDRDMVDRSQLEASRFHREAFIPAGLNHTVGMAVRLPIGEAAIVMGFDDPAHPGFASDRSLAILELLYPAFCMALELAQRRESELTMLRRAIGELPVAAVLLADDRELLAENGPHSRAMLRADAEGPALLSLPGPTLVDGRRTTYLLAPDVRRDDGLPHRPDASRALTARQAQVARLLASGHTDKQVARELGISPHTARSHAENILRRLGISSRSAVLSALLANHLLR